MVQVSIRFTFIVIISVDERAAKFKLDYMGKTYSSAVSNAKRHLIKIWLSMQADDLAIHFGRRKNCSLDRD